MKRVLFKKILISYLIIAPLLLLSVELYLSNVVREDHISRLRDSLVLQGRLIADRIPLQFTGDLDDFCRGFKEKIGARVTVIDASGRVLGDSDEPSAKMDNHLNRPEIEEAALRGVGSSVGLSKTVQKQLFYLAIAIEADSARRFLRLAVPLRDVESALDKIRIRVFFASLGGLLIALIAGIFHARSITRSVEEITAFSRDIASGNYERRLFLKEKDEIGELAKNINEMAQELGKRIGQSEEERNKMEAILRNLSDGLMLIDAKERILLCNEAVKKFFGIVAEIEGKTVMEALRSAEIVEVFSHVMEREEPLSREIEIAYPKELYLMAAATPFYAAAKERISGVVLTLHDITRLKQLEEMRKDFVANVSHEIRTPITAIKGFAETLLGGAIDDRETALKFLSTIKNHSERLNSLVNDLLTLSRIELGDITIEKSPVNFDEVIEFVFTTLRDKAHSKGLSLRREISPDFPGIEADRNRLIQVLLNLVDNGIKFTEEGGVTVRAQITKDTGQIVVSPAGAFCEISVEDTGNGIPKKHLPRLGERFYRVDRARSRELGGTGLGLAIVKHIVKAHGWQMQIESTEGKGTKVRIFIPVTA